MNFEAAAADVEYRLQFFVLRKRIGQKTQSLHGLRRLWCAVIGDGSRVTFPTIAFRACQWMTVGRVVAFVISMTHGAIRHCGAPHAAGQIIAKI
jgi:hypothetical protein